LVVGCPAGLVLEAWWPGVGNSRFRNTTVRVLLWRFHSVLGDQVGVRALLLKIWKVLIMLNKHGKSIVFRLSVKEYNHVCISEVL